MRRVLMSLAAPTMCALLAAATSHATMPAAPPTPQMELLQKLLSPAVAAGASLQVERVAGLPAGCTPTTATPLSPLDRSGPAVVDVSDATGDCAARVLVDVRVRQQVLVVTGAVAPGAPLSSFVALEQREVPANAHALRELPADALAHRALMPGRILVQDDVAFPGPAPGTTVKVVLRAGGLRVVRSATAMPCAGVADRRQQCARLPSGKQVHGTFHDGVIDMQEAL